MLNILFVLIIISVSTIIITVGLYAWFNKEDENVIEIKQTLKLLGGDTSNLVKNIILLGGIMFEVAQPLLNPGAIDVESEGVEGKKEEKYAAANANQPTSLSVENMTECVTRVIETLTVILPLVLEGGLRAEFGDEMWADMTSMPPPWNFEQSVRELKSHWNSIFSSTRSLKKEFEVLMDCLYRKRKEGMYCLHVGEARTLTEAAMRIVEGCPKDFPDAVNTKLAHAWQAVEEVRDVLKR